MLELRSFTRTVLFRYIDELQNHANFKHYKLMEEPQISTVNCSNNTIYYRYLSIRQKLQAIKFYAKITIS